MQKTRLIFIMFYPPRSPALIGCFVVDRLYFEEIGLLDEGMEVYGGENVELGIRVSNNVRPRPWPIVHPRKVCEINSDNET